MSMRQNINENETSNTNSTQPVGTFNADSNNNTMSTQHLTQGGGGLFDPSAIQRQQQLGVPNGMMGNPNTNMANVQAGPMPSNTNSINAINNMNGMMNNMNYGNGSGNGNFVAQNPLQGNMNPNMMNQNANVNNFNVNEFMRLQQQLQQQQLQQQLQLQQQMQMQQQMQQAGSNLNNTNAQNLNFGLMATQQNQNQNQPSNNASNNNVLQSFIGRNQQFAGGGGLPLQGQTNIQQNPFLGHLIMNQQTGVMGAIGTAGLVGPNQSGATGPSLAGGANNFQLPSPNALFSRDASRRMRGGVIEPFPEKLHRLLLEVEAAGRADVISFVANGRAFAIHKADNFFKEIVPLYFRQSRLSSFKRQLNLYGFELINTGPARGGYYHEMFVKERPELCRRMRRVAVKVAPTKDGTGKKKSKSKNTDNDESTNLSIKGEEDCEGSKSGEAAEGVEGDAGEQAANVTTEISIEDTIKQVTEQLKATEGSIKQTTNAIPIKTEDIKEKTIDEIVDQSTELPAVQL